MTFNTIEESNYNGEPVRLYEIMFGNRNWYYASADRDIVFNGITYVRSNFSDDGIIQSGDPTGDALTITCDTNIDIVAEWRGTPPGGQVFMTIRDMHYNDADHEAPVVWIGTISDVKRPTPITAQIVGQTLSMTFKRGGLRLTVTRNCPYFLYDASCRKNPADYQVTLTITALGGDWFEADGVSAFEADYFAGGYIEWDRDGTFEKRGIELQLSATRCQLMGATDKLTVGQQIFAYPGCARVTSVCNSKFNNLVNYGGFPGMPGRSPFDGNPVF